MTRHAGTRLGQRQRYRPMFGSYGAAPASLAVAFVSQASIEDGFARRVALRLMEAIGDPKDGPYKK